MKHLIPEFEKLKARFPRGFESSLVLPCVRRIQEDRGYVADSDIDGLVEYLGVPRMQIEQVLSYYTQFRRKPIGRCTSRPAATSPARCGRRAAHRPPLPEAGGRAGRDHRGRPLHAVDGRVPRLLRHGAGVMVNDTYHENMSAETLDALLNELK